MLVFSYLRTLREIFPFNLTLKQALKPSPVSPCKCAICSRHKARIFQKQQKKRKIVNLIAFIFFLQLCVPLDAAKQMFSERMRKKCLKIRIRVHF